MLKELRLRNFKAWRDTGPLSLKPVTMLLGTNSSGKSSLIQSILLLKQTVQSPDRSMSLNLGGDEIYDLFNFGSFENVLCQSSTGDRTFVIDFEFESQLPTRFKTGRFHCAYGQNSAGGVVIQDWHLRSQEQCFRVVRRERGAYSLFLNEEGQPREKGRQFVPERSISFSAEALAGVGPERDDLQDLSLVTRRELEGVVYLGPLRRKPERDYVWNKSTPGELGTDGSRVIDVLLASALMKGDDQIRVIEGVSKWLRRMKVADRLEVKQLGRSTRYELVVHRDGVEANLRDVGIGISQVLPVLTVAYFAPAGSTVLLEEPEIHLHPLAQATLAELFVEVSIQRKIQFIVETHSEHLFRRMQTLIAKQQITLDHAAMYFVENDGRGAALRALDLDEYGRVRNWPAGFFGDALGETREQARLMFERQQEKQQ